MRPCCLSLFVILTACAGPRPAPQPAAVATPPSHALRFASGPSIDLVRIEAGGAVARPFLIGRYELTRAQYGAFVAATGYDGADHPSSKPTEPFLADWTGAAWPDGTSDLPVAYVNLDHARAYCAWATRVSGRVVRLPTDAEWELAAGGEEGRAFPWGNTWDASRCNWGDAEGSDGFGVTDGFSGPAPVGSFPRGATPAGIHDLAGNIWEWTAEGSLRGGPWCLGPDFQRTDHVAHEDIDRADDKFGFRIVVEPLPPR